MASSEAEDTTLRPWGLKQMEAPNPSLLFKLSFGAVVGDVHTKEGKMRSTTVRGKMSGHTCAEILGDVAKMVTDPGSKELAGFLRRIAYCKPNTESHKSLL